MKTLTHAAVAAAAAGFFALSPSVEAAPITWNLASGCSSSGSGDGNTRTCPGSSGGSVTASAWSNTLGNSNTNIEAAYLASYSGGLGVRNSDWDSALSDRDLYEDGSPEHATDNNERYDSIRFDFGAGASVRLTNVGIGWYGNDSDITVLAYTGGGVPPLAGLSYSSLLSNGWSLVGHYANAGTVASQAINASAIYSRYWLVGAYNPIGTNPGYTLGNDAVKIKTLVGERRVPEPASLALLGFGLVLTARRLRSARV